MNSELTKIVDNLETVFRGDAWHGPSVMEVMNSLPSHAVDKKHEISKHTIAQLIFHMLAWRKFIIEKVNGNIHYQLETDEQSWGTAAETSADQWSVLKINLIENQKKLVTILENLDDSLLTKRVPGEYYDFYKLLTGVIQHDTYHLGMIWVLWE